jgi:prepilin-type N-terminal cleavage/methylation domain-containing protein
MDKKIKKGFSLIEVLIFVTILGLIFIAAMTLTTYSINVMKINQEKILAVHYSEEGLEWVRFQKESDWNYFTSLDTSTGGGTTYCLNNLSWSNQGSCSATSFFGVPNIYWREVTLTNQGGSPVNQSNVEEKVYWKNGGVNFNVSLKTTLEILE